jgi:enoyl-CoA hydratase/carnithine racemase
MGHDVDSSREQEPTIQVDGVNFEVRNAVAIITIDRPRAHNAMNLAVRAGLFAAFERVERDPRISVAILTGTGDRAFCAGIDLKEAAETQLQVPPRDFLPILGDTIEVSKPVIAAVNGIAFAGGWVLAQMCDLCVASTSASFAITEAKVGRGMPWAVPLIHMIPQRIMMELLLLGEPISAQRAYEIGFVNRVVAPDALMTTAMGIATRIVENAPLTVQAAKELVRIATETGRSAARRSADHLFERVYRSSDAQEGPRAFREKRAPRWRGE